jgi:hypothetical protein
MPLIACDFIGKFCDSTVVWIFIWMIYSFKNNLREKKYRVTLLESSLLTNKSCHAFTKTKNDRKSVLGYCYGTLSSVNFFLGIEMLMHLCIRHHLHGSPLHPWTTRNVTLLFLRFSLVLDKREALLVTIGMSIEPLQPCTVKITWYLSNDNTECSLHNRDQPKTIMDVLHPTTTIQIMDILGGCANLWMVWLVVVVVSFIPDENIKCVSIWLRLHPVVATQQPPLHGVTGKNVTIP